jgi:hypothetical protein
MYNDISSSVSLRDRTTGTPPTSLSNLNEYSVNNRYALAAMNSIRTDYHRSSIES